MSVLTQFFPAGGGSSGIPVELMVMSGGGGGGGGGVANPCYGYGWGAGGGAMFYCRSFPLQPGVTYPITIGSGGSGGPAPGSAGCPGSVGGASCFSVPVDGGNTSICVAGGGNGRGGASGSCADNGGTGGAPGTGECGGNSYYSGSNNCNVSDSLSSGGYFGYKSPGCCGGSILTFGKTHQPTGGAASCVVNSWATDIYGSSICLSGGGFTLIGVNSFNEDRPANCGWGGSGGNTCIPPAAPYPCNRTACPGSNGGSGVVVVKYPSAYGAAPASPGATDCSPATPGFYTYRFTSPGSITLP